LDRIADIALSKIYENWERRKNNEEKIALILEALDVSLHRQP
jgi:hypothetical protein